MPRVRDLLEVLGELYPWELAVPGDSYGLLVGSPGSEVRSVMCSVDLSTAVLAKAAESGCGMLVTHHPQFFRPLPDGLDLDCPVGRVVGLALEHGISVVSCHTNADSAGGGVADLMAEKLGLTGVGPLLPAETVYIAKVVVFVPPEALEDVSDAMASAGAGEIGGYLHCSFRATGTGTFLPGEGTEPYSGQRGRLNLVDEVRLEMVAPSFKVRSVVEALKERHPYEEVAYDVYRLEIPVPWGIGRVGETARRRTPADILNELSVWTGSRRAFLEGDPRARVLRIAVVPGSGSGTVEPAVRAGCDLLVTGELGHHQMLEARESGLSVICLGHLESERPFVPSLTDRLRTAAGERGWEVSVEGYRDEEGVWG